MLHLIESLLYNINAVSEEVMNIPPQTSGIFPPNEIPHSQTSPNIRNTSLLSGLAHLKKTITSLSNRFSFSFRATHSRTTPKSLKNGDAPEIKAVVQEKKVTSFERQSAQEQYKEWSGAIHDSYIDLSQTSQLGKDTLKLLNEAEGYATFASKKNPVIENNSREDSKAIQTDIIPQAKQLGFKQIDGQMKFFNPKTGTIFTLFQDEKKSPPEIGIAFWGLMNSEHLKGESSDIRKETSRASISAAVKECLGGVSEAAKEAMELGKILKDIAKEKGFTPVVVGHSHGGGLAQCAALSNGIKAFVFNSRPLGAGIRKMLGKEVIKQNADKVTVFSIEGDFLTQNKALNRLAIATESRLGISVARTVGKGYILPKPQIQGKSLFKSHNRYLESIQQLKNKIQTNQTRAQIIHC